MSIDEMEGDLDEQVQPEQETSRPNTANEDNLTLTQLTQVNETSPEIEDANFSQL